MTSPVSGISANELGAYAIRAFLGLLVVNALIAIGAILGATGDSDWQIVGTSLLLTAGCLTIAANAAAIERQRLTWMPYLGASLSCLAFGVLIILLWAEPASDGDLIWKPTLIALTLGLSATYASLLSIPPLRGVFQTAQVVGYGAVGVLALMTVVAILAEQGTSAEIYAVLSVVLATATIIVLVGAIVARRADRVGTSTSASLYCPACRAAIAPLESVGDEHRCGSCGLGFRVTTFARNEQTPCGAASEARSCRTEPDSGTP